MEVYFARLREGTNGSHDGESRHQLAVCSSCLLNKGPGDKNSKFRSYMQAGRSILSNSIKQNCTLMKKGEEDSEVIVDE